MPAVSVTIPGLQSARYQWRRIESMLGSDTRNSSSQGSQGKLMSLIKPVTKDALDKLGYHIRRTPPERSKIKGSFPKLKIAAVDRSLSDPYQMYVF